MSSNERTQRTNGQLDKRTNKMMMMMMMVITAFAAGFNLSRFTGVWRM